MDLKNSRKLFSKALQHFPGGVNSPARAWTAVGGDPLFIERGSGSYVWDVDGNKYLDYVLSWGPLVLGHAHPSIVRAIASSVANGTSFGAPTKVENRLANLVLSAFPSMEMVRFVNSGTEAVMSAIRLARAYTDRNKIVKFEGGYHGHADSLLVSAGSGAAAHGVPSSTGVTKCVASDTLIAQYNDLESVEAHFEANPREIAALIVEPVAANMGVIQPAPRFLRGLKDLSNQHGSLLIFDEVVTGFRVAYGGAQSLFDIRPDITCLGKIIGGGLPVGAYGSTAKIMQRVSPLGPMYQAGTLSGNPVAMSAGIATLEMLRKPETYDGLESMSSHLERELYTLFKATSIPIKINRVGSMMTLFFSQTEVTNWRSASESDQKSFGQLFHAMLKRNVYLPPSPFEAMFLSTEHDEKDINSTVNAFRETLDQN